MHTEVLIDLKISNHLYGERTYFNIQRLLKLQIYTGNNLGHRKWEAFKNITLEIVENSKIEAKRYE